MAPDRRRITRLIAKLFKADPGAQARFSALTGENETTLDEMLARLPVRGAR